MNRRLIYRGAFMDSARSRKVASRRRCSVLARYKLGLSVCKFKLVPVFFYNNFHMKKAESHCYGSFFYKLNECDL
ncbi:hypothetical protein JCM14076_06190 [Methylosoma difficile]